MKYATRPLSRRQFLRAAATVATPLIVPASALGRSRRAPPSERITLAAIGEHSEGAFIAAVAVYGASLLVMLGMSAGYNVSVLVRRGGRSHGRARAAGQY